LAIVLCIAVVTLWQYFYAVPRMEQEQARRDVLETVEQEAAGSAGSPSTSQPADAPLIQIPRETALAEGQRINIASPSVSGSINLIGARFDDLQLHNYHETVNPESPEIVLLSPENTDSAYYAAFGLESAGGQTVPGIESEWKVVGANTTLSPDTPVTLEWSNDTGLTVTRRIELDENYMFAISEQITNKSENAVTVVPHAAVYREGTPKIAGIWILHEGLIGVFNETLETMGYSGIKDEIRTTHTSEGGWLGFTDKYWMTALIPDQNEVFTATFEGRTRGTRDYYKTDLHRDPVSIPAGQSIEVNSHFFAGAKIVSLIDQYETDLGITRFDLAIDWGWFYFLTKPLFLMLDFFYRMVGNFGVAILILTVVIKLAFFPLANKSYEAMSKMKKLQPEMVKLRERYEDDKVKQQQELMALYQKEKINPLSGCLPIFIQIPVFFALYKVLFVTIEMRHAPFFGWINDLAAPDPTSLFNLFGLIPIGLPDFLIVGIWPIIMGVSMYIQTAMNPAPPDPVQAKIFMYMPILFTFLLASFPAGLVIYWAWNNVLSIAQQYVIMSRMGVEIELQTNLMKLVNGVRNLPSSFSGGNASTVHATATSSEAGGNADDDQSVSADKSDEDTKESAEKKSSNKKKAK